MKIIFTLLLFPLCAFAGGKAVGNGGDEVALSFQNSALRAVEGAVLAGIFDERAASELRFTILSATILTTDQALNSEKGGVAQESVVVNVPEISTIIVSRFRWLAISNLHAREGIALHEALSLRGIEGTGDYHFSGAYAGLFLLDASELHPALARTAEIVGCADYNNSLFKVTALRGGLQRVKITPVSTAARIRFVNFLAELGVSEPGDVSEFSFDILTHDCVYDPRIRGKMDCGPAEGVTRPATLTLSRRGGTTENLDLSNLRFRVATPFQRVTPAPNVIAFMNLGVAIAPSSGDSSRQADLDLFLNTGTCR